MKKRILSILLICCMMLTVMPMTASAATGTVYCNTCGDYRTFDMSYVSIGDKQHRCSGICQTCKNPGTTYWATHSGSGTATCTTGIICDKCGAEFGVLGHELGEWQQGDGKHWKECSRCKAKVEEGRHNWSNPYVYRKEPTCTAAGYIEYTCSWCSLKKTETLNALGHDYVHHEAQAPTCTEIGWDAYDNCSRCDYTTYVEIPASGHSFGEWEEVTPPSCTDKGSEERTCSACKTIETRDVNPNGHSWESDYTIDKEATCESDGSKSIHCSKCDAVKDSETITATGHDYESSVTTAATCTTEGVRTYVCKNDSSHTYTEPIPSNGHALVHHEAQPATCIAIGWNAYDTCNNCAYTTYTEIPATGHDYESSVTTAATCTTEGVRTYVCKNDSSHTYTEPIPSNGHALVHHEAQPATCIAIGWNAYDTCNNCAYTTYTEIPATGHSFGDWETVTSPTCTDKGSEKRTCTVCQAVETRDIDPNGHDLVHHDAKAATKAANGNIEYWYCEGCGKYFSDKDGTKKIKKADTVTAKMKDDSKSPQTGDTSNLVLWITLLFVSSGAAIGTTVVSRKKKYNR